MNQHKTNHLSGGNWTRGSEAVIWCVCFVFACLATTCHSAIADDGTNAKPTAKPNPQGTSRFVHSPRASVRCGPGQQFYATMILERGAAVDVFIETPDGWSGIRPPEGSHDWVPADSLCVLPGGKVAEVSVDRIAAWIDALRPDEKTLLFQTELVKSQTVSILGEATREEGGESRLWFHIAPPPGEFRWVRTSQLGVDPVAQSTSEVKLAGFTAPPTSTASSDVMFSNHQGGDDGEVVWSDETDQIANIEREIRQEQAEIERQMHVAHGPVTKASSQTKKQPVSAHDKDQSYWNAMQGTSESSMKVGPMSGVLGWLGFSIVEAGPMNNPQPTHNASANTTSPTSGIFSAAFSRSATDNLQASNLDHLPRPSRRNATYNGSHSSPSGLLAQESNAAFPIEGTLSTLMRSRGPLFGGGADTPLTGGSLAPNPLAPNSMATPTSASGIEGSGIAMANYRILPPANGGTMSSEIPDRFQTQAIQDAMIQLSAMVSKPTEQWNLEAYRVSAKSWIELGDSPLVRGEARLLLDRIEQFESLRQRTLSIHGAPSPTLAPLTEAVPKRTAESGSDASGWMVSVHTTLPGQPEFALTDDSGNVIAYVRPTTGLNLRRYLQQPVTVYGMPGYLPNLAAKQIIAERVVRLR